jgi:uncharacterized protein
MADPTETAADETGDGPVRFMQQVVALDYKIKISPVTARFTTQLGTGRIVGHKCPSCGLVFVPPKGYCPLCVMETGPDDEVEVADRGTVTSFTILTPIQYYGQKEREEYALASILLDGADSTVGQQRLGEVPLDQVRTGMRVEAEWRPEGERGGQDPRGGLTNAVVCWRPSGESDAARADYEEHVL